MSSAEDPETVELSPAERYASYRASRQHPVLRDFRSLHDFPLDDFQVRACEHIEEGRGVLVAAPTGSGKTIVGEFAIHLALATGRKAFYTTPIKALSNQKFHDLVRRYGPEQVGLLTGDNVVNGEAPIVVMTTEVLRNMLYAGSRTLIGLGFVVMDEVHYLADRSRGAVWEEVIIHLPESVSLVSLSATVSNAEEFGEWLETVRGDTATVVEEKRPVPLYQHVMVGRRLLDLFASSDVDAAAGFVKEGAPVNDELMKVARDDWAASRIKDRRSSRGSGARGARQVGNGRRVWIPSRSDVIDRLERERLLPAIVFIFSRVGCDAAVTQCLNAGVRLTTPEERDAIHDYVEDATRHLAKEDLHVLGYHDFLEGLTRGVAAHHAGMLPAFKQCVEELFVRGLCKVVFATETLALGINMPARTVVIEKLTKWNGETHADITPGEYTQLTGRAGRRGLDVEGHGVVLWQPGMNPRELAGLASTRTYPLRSSFRPSYNMAVNLVHQFGRARSRELLEQSFAQFQADKAVVGLARQLRKSEDALEGYREAASCHLGDFMEYAALRRRISDVEKEASRSRRQDRREEVLASLARLKIGDVIDVPAGKFAGYAVVVDPGWSEDNPRPSVVTQDRQARRLGMIDFPTPVEALTRIRVPRSFNGRNPQMRRDLASALRARTHDLTPPPVRRGRHSPSESGVDPEVAELRRQLKAHPCHGCPDREDHSRWAERYFKLERDARTLQRRVEQRTNTVARQFDRVCDVLAALDYLDGEEITARGRHLMRLYSELDLVAAECIRHGVWDDLGASELAAVLSVLVFEARRPDDASSPRLPGGRVRDVIGEMVRLWGDLDRLEKEHRLDFLRQPDLGFAWLAYRWAEGDELDDVLGASELSAGDFVRWMKQLLDLAGQVADAAGDTPLRSTAREVVKRLKRGVVAYSGLAED
ncbi:DEAD/DEAH box helicase [Nocardioides sp. SYSU DS0663]|uniref:DEAD/DEAH box helicase n=1 Tax=Nocardioides sp. SYSU DS0663 TaxID=3416445 RepID=UPI003F4C114A